MALEELIFGFIAGAAGSFVMWLLVAPRLIVRFGQKALEAWVDKNIPEDPESDAAAHKPLDPRLKRVLSIMTYHVGQSIAGVFGDLSKKINEEIGKAGPEMIQKMAGGADLAGLAKQFTGGKGGKSPFGGLAEMFSMFQMFQQMTGAMNGGGAAAAGARGALPAHPWIH